MKFTKTFAWPLFVFWTLAALVMFVLIAQHPLDGRWWLTLAICLGGVAFYFPFPVSVRICKTISIERPLPVVYDFLSRPSNLHIWIPRVGPVQPANVRVEVGQEWSYPPTRRWIRTTPMRHIFSKLEPPHLIEITATGHGLRAVTAYIFSDVGKDTELMVDVTLFGLPAPVAWLTQAIVPLFPSADLARLKRALEVGSPTS